MKTNVKRSFGEGFWRWPIMMITLLGVVMVWAADPTTTTTQPEGEDPENTMIINTQTADCPQKCMKSGRCDKLCRSRVVAELQMIEKIQMIFTQSLQAAEPAQQLVIDQSRFCPREVIQIRSPAAVLPLANLQGFKGALSEHSICTAANGYTVPGPPPPVQHPAFNHTEWSADRCFQNDYVFYPKTIYLQPVLTGSVKFQCAEDDKTKTMSWKMIDGCKIFIPTQYDVGLPTLIGSYNHCPAPQPPQPPACAGPPTCGADQTLHDLGNCQWECRDNVPMCLTCVRYSTGEGGGCEEEQLQPCGPQLPIPTSDGDGGSF